MSLDTKLAEMLCTRFCHDIIGPVGAVSNGAEFLREEMRDVQSQAADLIESSSKEAVSRVQFYRQAYGHAPQGSSASLTDMQTLSAGFLSYGKVKLNWDDKYTDMSGENINHGQKKIILNLIVIAAATLIRGGSLTFQIGDGSATLTAKGDVVKFDDSMEQCLKGNINSDSVDPKLVQIFYTSKVISENSAELNIEKTSDSITFKLRI